MKLFGIIFILFGLVVFGIDTTPKYAYAKTNWSIPQYELPKGKLGSSLWNIPITTLRKKHTTKKPPQEVVNYAKTLAARYGIEVAAILSACYHERGIKNWYDDFLCGFGAINNRPSTWNKLRFGGWQKQLMLFAKRAKRCGYFREGIQVTTHHAQMFAKHCYKTEAWQNYGRIVRYINYFKGVI